MNIMIFTGQSG